MARQVHDYFAVAVAIARRHYRSLLARFHDDVIQECHLLAWEAQVRRYVTVRNGNKVRCGRATLRLDPPWETWRLLCCAESALTLTRAEQRAAIDKRKPGAIRALYPCARAKEGA